MQRPTVNAKHSDFAKLVRMIRTHTGPQKSSAILHLNPPELGRMRVNVSLEKSQLTLSVHTESSHAKHVIAERMDLLRQSLDQHGVAIERFDVSDSLARESADDSRGYQPTSGNRQPTTTSRQSTTDNRQRLSKTHDIMFERVNAVDGRIDIRI